MPYVTHIWSHIFLMCHTALKHSRGLSLLFERFSIALQFSVLTLTVSFILAKHTYFMLSPDQLTCMLMLKIILFILILSYK